MSAPAARRAASCAKAGLRWSVIRLLASKADRPACRRRQTTIGSSSERSSGRFRPTWYTPIRRLACSSGRMLWAARLASGTGSTILEHTRLLVWPAARQRGHRLEPGEAGAPSLGLAAVQDVPTQPVPGVMGGGRKMRTLAASVRGSSHASSRSAPASLPNSVQRLPSHSSLGRGGAGPPAPEGTAMDRGSNAM